MSYDVRLKAKIEGYDKYIDLGCDVNITWNVRSLIAESSGWEIKNMQDNGLAEELAAKLERGINELEKRPEEYRHLEASNGWGTISGTLEFYRSLLNGCIEHPYAHVFVE